MPELTPFAPRGSKGFLAYERHKLQSERNFKQTMGLYGKRVFQGKKRVLGALASRLGEELDEDARKKYLFLVGASDTLLPQTSIEYGVQHAKEFQNIKTKDRIAAALFVARAHKSATQVHHARHFLESLEESLAELKIRGATSAEEIHDASAKARLGMLYNSLEIKPLAPEKIDRVTRLAFGGFHQPDQMALGEILASRYVRSGVPKKDYRRYYLRKKRAQRGYGLPYISLTGNTLANLRNALGNPKVNSEKEARKSAFEDFSNVGGLKAPSKSIRHFAFADMRLSHGGIRKAVEALSNNRRESEDRITMALAAARFYDAAVSIYGRKDIAERVLSEFKANSDYSPKTVRDKIAEYRLEMLSYVLKPLLDKMPKELEKKQAELLHAYNTAKNNYRDPNTMALVELKVKSILDQARIEVALQANPKASQTQLVLNPAKAMLGIVEKMNPDEIADVMDELDKNHSAASVINREILFSPGAADENPSHVIARVARLIPEAIR